MADFVRLCVIKLQIVFVFLFSFFFWITSSRACQMITFCRLTTLTIQTRRRTSTSQRRRGTVVLSSPPHTWTTVWPWPLKGKERKRIYIAPLYTMYISKRSGMDHSVLPANTSCMPFLRMRSPDGATSNWGKIHLITAYYSSIDPEGMKGWVGLVGWPIADGLPT